MCRGAAARAEGISSEEARDIAKEAYVYGYPLVDNYRVLYSYFVDSKDPEYKGAWNEIHSAARVYTPEDKAVQTPNSDTPYSFVGADLRTEPLILTLPRIEKDRYFSVQFVDLYTFNFAYLGSRATGNNGGKFLLAGPGWKGEAPKGVKSVIRSETGLALLVYRTQLFKPADIENVKKVQAGYKVQTLSQFTGKPAPEAAPAIDFIKPLDRAEQRASVEFFKALNFALGFCPAHPSETDLMARFAKLGIGAGGKYNARSLSPEIRAAVQQGIADAWNDYQAAERKMAAGELDSGDLFGTRDHLKNNYLYRMTAAVNGIYGNSKMEALYPLYAADAGGHPLDGSKHRYTLRFLPGQLPPVKAFWSLTLYEMPSRLLVANPLNRYLINSPMLPDLKRDQDGGLTLYVQKESPGADKEANWLPAPAGPFFLALRLYWPKPEALNKRWTKPTLEQAGGLATQ